MNSTNAATTAPKDASTSRGAAKRATTRTHRTLVRFPTWETSHCERCARQLRREGFPLSTRGKTLPEDQLTLFPENPHELRMKPNDDYHRTASA